MAARTAKSGKPTLDGRVMRYWPEEANRVYALYMRLPADDRPMAGEVLRSHGYRINEAEHVTMALALARMERVSLLQCEYVLDFYLRQGRLP